MKCSKFILEISYGIFSICFLRLKLWAIWGSNDRSRQVLSEMSVKFWLKKLSFGGLFSSSSKTVFLKNVSNLIAPRSCRKWQWLKSFWVNKSPIRILAGSHLAGKNGIDWLQALLLKSFPNHILISIITAARLVARQPGQFQLRNSPNNRKQRRNYARRR